MCGIVGIFSLDRARPLPLERANRALRLLDRRGPDDEGHYEAPGLWFGHRRLSILDPTHGRQPWVESKTAHALVYNGELYNFRELRESQLSGDGLSLGSTGDTAVLSALLVKLGWDALPLLRGMFAFAWYDPFQDRILLVRDRLGIKPLYYAWRDQVLYFASTVPALLQIVDGPRRVNGTAMTHYLATARTSFGRDTLFEGIHSLQAGEWLQLHRRKGQEPVIHRYWSPPILAEAEKNPGTWETALAHCRTRVQSIVREQMVSDVPVGAFLSGGLDSSIIAASIPDAAVPQIFTFNIGYQQSNYNEWSQAQEVAQARGLHCTHINLGEADQWNDLEQLIQHKGIPLSTPNEIAIWKLAEAFAHRGHVALTGEGADEIFGGYPLPTLGALDYDRSRHATTPAFKAALNGFYGRAHFESRADHFLALNSWTHSGQRNQWLRPEWHQMWAGEEKLRGQYEDWFRPLAACSTTEAYLHLHVRINLEGLLSRVDTSTMAASVEARVPFTDHRLVEWAFALPDHWKIALSPGMTPADDQIASHWMQSGRIQTKRILRDAFHQDLPKSIYHRPKMSFPSPFLESLRGSWHAQADTLLRESTFLKDKLAPPPQQLLGEGLATWLWVNLALWARIWGVE